MGAKIQKITSTKEIALANEIKQKRETCEAHQKTIFSVDNEGEGEIL